MSSLECGARKCCAYHLLINTYTRGTALSRTSVLLISLHLSHPPAMGITPVAFGEAVITPLYRCLIGWRIQQGFPQSSGELAQVSFPPGRSRQIRVAIRILIPAFLRSDTGWYRHGDALSVLLTGALYQCYRIQFSRYREGFRKVPSLGWG